MTKQECPDISKLTGREVEKVATTLVTGNLEFIFAHRNDVVGLKTEEFQRIIDLAGATRANCGGFGCG